MSAKHTPAPWHSMNENAIIPLKSVYCERLGFQIGFVNTDKKSVEAEAQANAYLISAAPDLLAALKLYLEWVEAEDDHSKADFYQRMEMCKAADQAARAAVAKATGEQS